MKRISIGKKKRFEIFKRDGFCCAYCGRTPPLAVLEVDHIVSVANNGGNEDHNLVTSCKDCNRGKGKNPLNVAPKSLKDLAEETKEAEAQLREFNAIIERAMLRKERDCWDVIHELYGDDKNSIEKDVFRSIGNFLKRMPKHEVIESAEIASSARISVHKVFKYFCGVCWKKIKEREDCNG